MATLFDLQAIISLNSKDYEQGLDDASQKSNTFGNKLKNGLKKAAKIGAAAIGAVTAATGALATAMIKGVGDVASYGDNIDKMSQKMGLSAEAYQEWDAIMQHSGTSIESLQAGMKTLANAVANGNKAFKKLGISEKQIAKMSNEELFEATIAALQNVEDETERTYLAGQLLGRGATELGALLNTSAEDTEKMRQRVHELGGVMSNEAVKASAAYQDSLQDMQTAFSGLSRNMLSEFLPSVTKVMDGLTEVFASGGDSGIGIIKEGVTEIIKNIESAIPQFVNIAGQIVTALTGAIIENLPWLVNTGLQMLFSVVNGIVENIPKVLLVGADIISQIVKDISAYLPGILFQGTQVLSKFIQGIIEALPDLFNTAGEIINTIVTDLGIYIPILLQEGANLLVMLIQGIAENLPELLSTALSIVSTLITDIITYAPNLIATGKTVFNYLVQELPGILSDAKDQVIGMIDNLGDQLAEKYPALAGVFENLETVIEVVVGAIAGFKTAMFIKDVMTKAGKAIEGFGTTISTIMSTAAANPIGIAIAAIGALIGIIVTLYNTNEDFRDFVNEAWSNIKTWIVNAKDNIVEAWDKIKTKAGELWDKIKGVKDNIVGAFDKLKSKATEIKDNITSAFERLKGNVEEKWNNIKDAIMGPIEDAKSFVHDQIEKIKGFFDFDWELPKIKLPHFSIKGEFSLNPPSVPHLAVEWKRNAMNMPQILNGATIFGAMDGKLLGAGEAGPEVVSGADTLMNMIRDAVDERDDSGNVWNININIDGAQYDDADELANVIAEKLQSIVDRRSAAWA